MLTNFSHRGMAWMPLRTLGRALMIALALMFGPAGQSADAANLKKAEQLVQSTSQRLIDRLRSEQGAIQQDNRKLHAIVKQIILPHFDFERMSRWILGRYWRKAPRGQKAEFINEFKGLLIRTYSTALADNANAEVLLQASRPRGKAEATVRTVVQKPNGPGLKIAYEMYERNGVWKAYDISVEGVSLIVNYRTSYQTIVRQEGFDGLLKELRRSNSGRPG